MQNFTCAKKRITDSPPPHISRGLGLRVDKNLSRRASTYGHTGYKHGLLPEDLATLYRKQRPLHLMPVARGLPRCVGVRPCIHPSHLVGLHIPSTGVMLAYDVSSCLAHSNGTAAQMNSRRSIHRHLAHPDVTPLLLSNHCN